MSTPTRQDRVLDLAALVLIVAGAGVCLVASGRLQDIAQLSYRHPGPRSVSQLAAADRARHLWYAGEGAIAAGFLTGMAGAVRVIRRKGAPAS